MQDVTPEAIRENLVAQPQNCEGWLQYGLALHAQGRLAEAREAFSRGLSVNPFHVQLRQQRGRKFMASHFWQAVSDFTLVTRLEPSFWEAWYYMGVAYAVHGEDAEANRCFTRCLQEARAVGDSLVPVVDWLYTTRVRLGDENGAREALSHAEIAAANPEDEDYSYARRLLLYKGMLGEDDFFDEAVLRQRGTYEIDYVTQAYGLAFHRMSGGKRQEAVALLKDIVSHDQYPTAFAWLMANRDLKEQGIEIRPEVNS